MHYLPSMKNQSRRFSPNAGFGLIELMVIIAVIGILAALVFPQVVNWLPDLRLRNASQNLMADIQLAKVEALERNENVVVAFTTVVCVLPDIPFPNGGYTIFADLNADNILDAGEPVIKQLNLPQNSGLCGQTFAGGVTGFLPNGLLINNNNGTVTLANTNSRTHILTVSAAGGVSLN